MSVPNSRNPEEDPAAALGETLKDLRLAAVGHRLQERRGLAVEAARHDHACSDLTGTSITSQG